tara:strand:- start:4382 stop:4684 length:303 start_codon:yes stop_codon:yes gene_type:complete
MAVSADAIDPANAAHTASVETFHTFICFSSLRNILTGIVDLFRLTKLALPLNHVGQYSVNTQVFFKKLLFSIIYSKNNSCKKFIWRFIIGLTTFGEMGNV